jgi:hypothetical protein
MESGLQRLPRTVTIDLTERNNFGILDHFVKLSSGEVILVLMRAIKNGEGCFKQ